MMFNYHNYSRRPIRSRLRKRKKGLILTPYRSVYPRHSNLRVYHSSLTDRHRREGPLFGGLHKAWLGYVIAKSQCDYEKMRKYATAIQKSERRLDLAINEFPDLGLYSFDAFEDKEEDEDSKLAIIDPFTNEKIKEAGEDKEDEEYDINLYGFKPGFK